MSDGSNAIFGMFSAAQTTAVLSAAIELGVFAALASEAHTAEEVASQIETPLRSTRILLDALVVLEPAVLSRIGSRYNLTQLAQQHLVPGKPKYLGDLAPSAAELEGLAQLANAVRNNGTVLDQHALTQGNPHWEKSAQACGYAMQYWARLLAQCLAPWIQTRTTLQVLDVACGSGVNGLEIAAQHAKGHVTFLDQSNVLSRTREVQQKFSFPDERVSYLDGDLRALDFGGPFDIVLLSHIMHFFDPATCQGVAKKAADALAPDGRVVLHERLVNNLEKKDASMFSVEMLSWSPTGEAYAKHDYDEWFRLAGLGKSEATPYPNHFLLYRR